MEASVQSIGTVARIFDIKRMAVHDGPGIRTTVFFKGCPLHCLWCHSPESRKPGPELKYVEHLCQNCGSCVPACPRFCHGLTPGGIHQLDRQGCLVCGNCVRECPHGALDIIGREVSVPDLAREILKDRRFFAKSGGGVTLSGGEVLAQIDAAEELARLLKEEGTHVCIDTCGHVPWAHFARILPYTDLFLYDLKERDEERHRLVTGAGIDRILDNLERLDAAGKDSILRCPLVPGVNLSLDYIRFIAGVANRLRHVQAIHLLPFHPFGTSKSAMIGLTYALEDTPCMEEVEAEHWMTEARRLTSVPVSRG